MLFQLFIFSHHLVTCNFDKAPLSGGPISFIFINSKRDASQFDSIMSEPNISDMARGHLRGVWGGICKCERPLTFMPRNLIQ